MKRAILGLLAATAITLIFSSSGYGIPAFARKYKTSCQTCHNGFPKLNGFGEAFRRNGYQFPGGTDAEFIKEDPVSLGSEGNKKAFPDAIWPGTIPGSSPISPFFNGDGTLELNRMFLIFSNLIGDQYAFNVRLGAFEPGLFSFSTHRAWMEGFWLTTRPFSDDMGWSIEEFQKGLEVNGIIQGRWGYSAGIVEAFGDPHSDKDYYAHLTYKFEGMPLDGVTSGGPAINNPQPYIDNSLTLGAFIYHGNASLGTEPSTQGNQFTMGGGDVNAYWDRLNLFGGAGIRHDENPLDGNPGISANTTVWFTELDVVAFPWLLPGLRFEQWKSEAFDAGSGGVASYTDGEFVPGVVALIRPNLKMTLRTTIEKFDSRGDSKYDIGQVSLGLALGI